MGAAGGTALRLLGVSLYILALLCSIVILAIYSYFLASFSTHDVRGPNWVRAVEGISGAGVLYTLVASILTCFLGGIMVFAFIGILLNILFFGGYIAIAIMARGGASSCTGDVRTPQGNGDSKVRTGWDGAVFTPTLGTACTMNKAVLAVAILGAFLFLIAAAVQLWIGRHHQREKRTAPALTTGPAKAGRFKFFKRGNRHNRALAKDAEAGIIPPTTHHNGLHNGVHDDGHNGVVDSSYNTPAMHAHHNSAVPTAGGYHTGPAGSAVNPYSYDSRPAH